MQIVGFATLAPFVLFVLCDVGVGQPTRQPSWDIGFVEWHSLQWRCHPYTICDLFTATSDFFSIRTRIPRP